MFRKLLATSNDWTLTLLRLVMGVIFFAHGAQKTFGWFGGYGFSGTMGFFTQMMHIPAPFAFLAICAEFLGGLGLILGAFLGTRFMNVLERGGQRWDKMEVGERANIFLGVFTGLFVSASVRGQWVAGRVSAWAESSAQSSHVLSRSV